MDTNSVALSMAESQRVRPANEYEDVLLALELEPPPVPVIEPERPRTLAEQVRYLHGLRQALAAAREEVAQRRAQWEAANALYLEQERLIAVEAAEVDARLRREAVEVYLVSADKRPAPGVTIKVTRIPGFSEPEAIKWAREHGHQELIREEIDAPAFAKVALALHLPFVEWRSVATASLARDFGPVLAGGA